MVHRGQKPCGLLKARLIINVENYLDDGEVCRSTWAVDFKIKRVSNGEIAIDNNLNTINWFWEVL